jgi:hypothetical protein
MASEVGKRKKRKIRYFFVNVDGEPHVHKVLHVNRAKDLMIAWDYIDHKRKLYCLSDVKKTMQHGYSMKEAAEILNRAPYTLRRYFWEGRVKEPQMIYNLETKRPSKHILSGDDILAVQAAMAEIHTGRPRKDGYVTSSKTLPDRATTRTLVQQGQILYTLDEDGNPIPIWKEQVW